MITIFLADDHPVVRDGLRAILETQPDFAVIGESGTGVDTVAQVKALRPDMLLLDLEMPEMDGVEALRQLQRTPSDTRVLVFTAYDSDERILAAVQAGAQGYVLKGSPREQVFDAIRVVYDGGSLLQPAVASKLLKQVQSKSERGASDAAEQPGALTPREIEVLRQLAQGQANKQIAARLGISERTVKFHVSAIFRKLNATNRTEAVTLAAQRGLISL
ncbi:MAG TPA: response regulator transcription factor [Anaerolineae bacterium]|nr:response regulator transcription factor [Anaerolineae bacterium]